MERAADDPGLLAIPIPFAECLEDRELLFAKRSPVVEIGEITAQHAVIARPDEADDERLLALEVRKQAPLADEPHAGNLVDPNVHDPVRLFVTHFDVPPAPFRRAAKDRSRRARQVCRVPSGAEDEHQLARGGEIADQTLQLARRG